MSAVPTGKALAQPGPARVRQVLVVNPNTNPAVTQRVRAAAAELETARVLLEVVNPVRGPFSIETAAERAHAEREAVALIAQHAPKGYDAYVLACFDDLALEGARAIVDAPVIGTCEAGIAAARAVSTKLAIVTTFDAAVPGIRALMQRYGAGPHATVRAAGIGVAAAAGGAQDTLERILQCAREAVLRDRAEVVLLASGGLTGLAPVLAEAIRRPVVDGVAAAIALAVTQVTAQQR